MKLKGIKSFIASIVAVVVSSASLLGTTFAWFTDSSTSGINKIESGNLDVSLTYANSYNGTEEEVNENTKIFHNINGEKILWEPGAFASGRFKVSNNGTLALKYQLSILSANETQTPTGKTLADALTVYALARNKTTGTDDVMGDFELESLQIDSAVPEYDPMSMVSFKNGFSLDAYLLPQESITYEIGLFWEPTENDNEFNIPGGLSIDFAVSLVATQVSYENDGDGFYYDVESKYPEHATISSIWNGNIDTSWYNETDKEFSLTTAQQFAGLASLVDDGTTFEGKTITLDRNLDLGVKDENGEYLCFDPIGSYRNDNIFKGTFDGNRHTISNLYQNTWALNNGYYYGDLGLGLFGAVENATIKNLTLDGIEVSGESALCGGVVAVAGDNCVFENIIVKNANVADYQYYAGGIVGWASGKQTFTNCNVDSTTKIAAQWGDFDNSIGGLIGGISQSAEIQIKDCIVACRIDSFSDVTSSYQWYAYRRAGMLVGNSGKVEEIDGKTVAVAPQLKCENVTVIYGEWANYTYCEFAGTSWPFVRVQAGVSNSAYSNPRYGHPVDANGNEVVDDNHVHNDGEVHHELIVFDQLYGGGQGVYGNPTHEGVTIIYNNK